MFGVGFDTIKLYGLMALGVIVLGFLAVFKYRGIKIDSLEKVVEEKTTEIKARIKQKKQIVAKAKVEQEITEVVLKGESTKNKASSKADEIMDESMNHKVDFSL